MLKRLIAVIIGATLFLVCTSCEINSNLESASESESFVEEISQSESNLEESSEEESVVEQPKIKISPEKRSYVYVMDEEQSPIQIVAKVFEDSVEIDEPELSYTVENTSVCEIDGNTVVPKSVGSTKVSISYGEVTTSVNVSVCGKTTQALVKTFDEQYVNLYGRTYINNGKLCFDHVGTGLGVAFAGESLSVTIEGAGANYLCIFIDGEKEYSSRISIAQGTNTYKIADGLEDGFHTARIVKSSEIDDGLMKITNLTATDFYNAPENAPLYIEFIGDSITAGYGALGAQASRRTVENSDACSSFAYQTAALLGADYSMIAKQGICVKAHHWLQESMTDVYKYVSTRTKEEYAFSKQADIVVVNLGTNDADYIFAKDRPYANQFPIDYYDFLSFIREKNPDAYIICLYGFMGKDSNIVIGIHKAIVQMNDPKVIEECGSYAADYGGSNGHPTKDAHSRWANTLAEYIESNLI